ncbi:hypothetical protein E2C01_000728 [Portunus trituberculatus]|uniref:Uncharacterized protein n=1 Tax=Portunus trituberculatus TaxID=210409 RepID=A0A5B7CEW3_PORTR|nr:hypothetical protein [Portunus trituberculatus]
MATLGLTRARYISHRVISPHMRSTYLRTTKRDAEVRSAENFSKVRKLQVQKVMSTVPEVRKCGTGLPDIQ